jgi:hypothetical protein
MRIGIAGLILGSAALLAQAPPTGEQDSRTFDGLDAITTATKVAKVPLDVEHKVRRERDDETDRHIDRIEHGTGSRRRTFKTAY